MQVHDLERGAAVLGLVVGRPRNARADRTPGGLAHRLLAGERGDQAVQEHRHAAATGVDDPGAPERFQELWRAGERQRSSLARLPGQCR